VKTPAECLSEKGANPAWVLLAELPSGGVNPHFGQALKRAAFQEKAGKYCKMLPERILGEATQIGPVLHRLPG